MLKALVVDDSLILRRNINKLLSDMGYKVIAESKDGMEAISCYRRFEPDFVTMDITMPDMDGIEAVKEIKKINKNAKIIMITSHGQEDMVMSAIKAGAAGYILKPVNSQNLKKAIDKIFPELAQKEQTENSQKEKTDDDDLKVDDDF